MDNILKTKFVQLREHLSIDIKNIKFYKRIKEFVNKSTWVVGAFSLAFLISLWILNGFVSFSGNALITLVFVPFFLAFLRRLNLKYQPKFAMLSSKLPGFLRSIPFIKSSEDSFFYSKEKIAKALLDKNFQLVFYDFFNMAKNNIFRFEDQKRFTQNIIAFKSFLESGNYLKAADYFIELYGVAYQFEYLVYDDYQNSHDIELLQARKGLIDEFLHQVDIDDFSEQNIKSKSIYLYKDTPVNNPSTQGSHSVGTNSKRKVNWKKLMED